jgi:hypothetical protein
LAGVFLALGWWPFVLFPRNQVSWVQGGGLAFSPPAVAYDPEPLPAPLVPPATNPGFTVELSLEAPIEPDNGVPYILTIHDGRTPSNLVIGQWRSELLVRVPARRNPKRFREENIADLNKDERHVVAISSDQAATTFYIDGRFSHRVPGFVLEPDSMRGQLILGNGAAGKNSWTGTLFGVAIFRRALDERDVASHHAMWTQGTLLELAREPGLVALYCFSGGSEQAAADRSPARHHLRIPNRYVMLQKRVLGTSLIGNQLSWSSIRDITLNLLGFVPFGFFAFLYLRAPSSDRSPKAMFLATLAGGMLSLLIEVGQIWLPSRDSSLVDLILNTTGAGSGALAAAFLSTAGVSRERTSRPA